MISAQDFLIIGATSLLVLLPIRIEYKIAIAAVFLVLGLIGFSF